MGFLLFKHISGGMLLTSSTFLPKSGMTHASLDQTTEVSMHMWGAWIRKDTTADITKEPGEIWRTVLSISPKIIDSRPTDIVTECENTLRAKPRLCEERIEGRADWRNSTT